MSNAKRRHRRRRRRYPKNKVIDLGNGWHAVVPRQSAMTLKELRALPVLLDETTPGSRAASTPD